MSGVAEPVAPVGEAESDEPGRGGSGRSSRSTLAALAVALVATLGLVAVAAVVAGRDTVILAALDGNANRDLHGLASPLLTGLMDAFSLAASTPAIVVLLAASVAWLVYRHHRREGAFLILAVGLSVASNQVLKLLIHRPRPSLPWSPPDAEFSFPSGHSENGLAFYLALAIVVWLLAGRRFGVLAVGSAILLVALVEISRVYLGYHFVSDVIGGDFAAVAAVAIASLVTGLAAERRPRATVRDDADPTSLHD